MESYGLYCGGTTRNINSKGEAISFALCLASAWNEELRKNEVNLAEAQDIYDFIVKNVNLPDVPKGPRDELNGMLATLATTLSAAQSRNPPGKA